MEALPFSGNPLDSWIPYQIAFFVGLVVCIRTYMHGPECPSIAKMIGKTVIITGANTGIGKETALELARRGGHIIMACRDIDKGEETAKTIRSKVPNAQIHVMQLDLASFNSVRQFAKKFCDENEKLDVLINNAGVMLCPFTKTEDGHELHFQINYLSHFLLTQLLLDKLKAAPSARVINVSALAHAAARMNFDDLNFESEYSGREAYGQSKLAQLLFTHKLSEILKDTNVTVNALHPGIIKDTEILRHTSLYNSIYQKLAWPLTWLCMKTPKAGAQTTIYLAVSPDLEKITGKYFSDCQVKEPSKDAKEPTLMQTLWDVSIKLTQMKS